MVLVITAAGDLQWEVDSPCGDDGPADIKAAQWERAKTLAVAWVWALSGRQYGLFDVIYRPEWTAGRAGSRCGPRGGAVGDLAYMIGLPSINTTPVTVAPLPGPVNAVSEVLVNGSVVASGSYLVQRNQLVRTDGGTWPAFQNTGLAPSEVGTFQVTYVRGRRVPPGGAWAAGVLACELAKGMCGDGKCRLPANAVSVARNGTSISLDSAQLQKAFTTLTEVDQWCRQVNPKGRPEQPFVWSPDLDPDRFPSIPTSV